jgi:hypothetical protein
LAYFKEVKKHPFTLSHCWPKIKDYPKWQESFAAWYKDGSKKRSDDSTIDLEEGGPTKDGASKDGSRGHKASTTNLRQQASSIARENTLQTVFTEKEEASTIRDERRRPEKEEQK